MHKEQYKKLSKEDLPVFYQPFWLDAVATQWDVLLHLKNDKIIFVMPYAYTIHQGQINIYTPILTPYLGPYFVHPHPEKNVTRISREINILENIIEQIPSFKYFRLKCPIETTNCLPFLWHQFNITIKYTYYFPHPIDIDRIWHELKDTNRNSIRNAQKRLCIETSSDYNLLYELMEQSFSRKSTFTNIDRNLFLSLGKSIDAYRSGQMYLAKNQEGQVEAGALFVWDKQKVYYLIGGINTQVKQNGAMNLLVFQGINIAAQTNRSFDFEGSILKGIEQFFRSFGANLIPYYVIEKSNFSKWDILKQSIKQILS